MMLLISLIFPVLLDDGAFVRGSYDVDTATLRVDWGFIANNETVKAESWFEMQLRTSWGDHEFFADASPAIYQMDANDGSWPRPMTLNMTGPYAGNFTYLFDTELLDANVSATTTVAVERRIDDQSQPHHHVERIVFVDSQRQTWVVIVGVVSGALCCCLLCVVVASHGNTTRATNDELFFRVREVR